MENKTVCNHISVLKEIKKSNSHVCEECIRNGTKWVHLRVCQTCGQTLCCDQSPEQHMTKHYHASQHPVVASAQPGERWLWCYPDEKMVEY
ncbi:UBP-type zinc finger domain-containing protein [Niastella yeongjuensis]|uniref:UBP-type zinc finger domain-containing protein n=1 Tax=Niastella yeongjuensis TaxID=354355 RepID=UPI0008BF7393|nr:UBP-type zinc finger domain-containing protein [Niastella yeongjuensis]SEP41667.1 ubiquitin-hydrolase Zn-finger-containing protein [Niastella yeongjuensis]